MKRIFRIATVLGFAAFTGAVALSSPLQQGQTLTVGETISVIVLGEGPDMAVPVTLEVTEPTVVTLLATASDDTDPVFLARDQYGRDLITINDNPASSVAVNPLDAALDNTLLIAGTYTILVGRNGTSGSGAVDFSVFAGTQSVIGIGQIQLLDAAIAVNERYEQPIDLQEGEIVSFAAIGLGDEFDLRMSLRNTASGERLIANDDNETFDIFLTDLDPRIYQFRVPASGNYTVLVRAFSANQTGEFKLVIQRHGILSGEARIDVITGESENRARNILPVEFEAGEIVRITARALNESLDPEIDLLTPNLIFVASNDDHGTEATDLGRFDARIERIVIEDAGTYELDVNSVSGRGAFEVTIERLGVFTVADFPLVEAGTGSVFLPEPTLVPEVTAEPTSSN
ncbi:MAG: hypothetical protein KA401_00910 [Anaerolineae bacterium]|nr:hypothetical protein [Chloroflexota bacterium]MBP6297877.1 hypothetical protein [Anaerolineae bacterium]